MDLEKSLIVIPLRVRDGDICLEWIRDIFIKVTDFHFIDRTTFSCRIPVKLPPNTDSFQDEMLRLHTQRRELVNYMRRAKGTMPAFWNIRK